MHADLVAISNLYAADRAMDALRGEHEALSSAVRGAREAVASAEASVKLNESTVATVVASQRATDRELEDYIDKKKRAQKLIDTGAGDYAAAERQVAQCASIIDQLETRALELMEQRDGAESVMASSRRELAARQAELEAVRARLAARDAPIRAELAAALEHQRAVSPELPASCRLHYDDLRRRKRVVLVNVDDGCCSVCAMRIPPQKFVEVQKDRAVHTCVGCGGYILP
ncbi:MAG: hypothetical protein FJ090_13680 [Deltaproteobacteria bacterium]|nr:hypothetical protein [Deltaproteobacteria bacterium]